MLSRVKMKNSYPLGFSLFKIDAHFPLDRVSITFNTEWDGGPFLSRDEDVIELDIIAGNYDETTYPHETLACDKDTYQGKAGATDVQKIEWRLKNLASPHQVSFPGSYDYSYRVKAWLKIEDRGETFFVPLL